jgi:lysophospholipase L1-like esterase
MPAAKPSGKRITLDELKKRAVKGALSDKDLRSYFKLDEDRSKPFAPVIQINYARVDTGGKKLPDQEVAELYDQATSARLPKAPRKKPATSLEAAAAPIKILAEGDSWFNLPNLFMPKDAVDILRETYTVSSVAMWGDTLENMLEQKQYVQKLESGNFRHFLFSGGGNDVLGSIGRYVKTRTPGDTDPTHAPDYVKPTFATKVKNIIAGYEELADDVRQARGSRTVLYVHGYANAVPKPGGKYLGKRLGALGFDPATVGPLAAAIVAHMVGMFNTALQRFAAARANIAYVDLRTRVKIATDWHSDEIHPSAKGARKVAGAFDQAIKANSPSV